MNINTMEHVLSTIDRLGVVTVKQLHNILKYDNYRKTCRVVQKLEPFLNVERSRQKIVYLNKEGRQMIGSNREVKKSALFDHILLTNEAYIHFNCPLTWKREYVIETSNSSFIKVKGLKLIPKNRIVCDAFFERNGYSYFIEIDNTRKMVDNRKKIQKYLDLWPMIREKYQNPRLCIFTKSEKRKKTFLEWTRNIPNEVKTFDKL